MRYLPHTEADRQAMLGAIGAPDVDALFAGVPQSARLDRPVELPFHQGEQDVARAIGAFAAANVSCGDVPSFLGAGAYRHHVPAAVDYLIQRGEFLTSYTPYQPEISQGTLQYLFEFQTQVALITGMEVANASMYDGATSTAEAVMMALRLTKRRGVVLSGDLHPHYREVVRTTTRFLGLDIASGPAGADGAGPDALMDLIGPETGSVVVQNPDIWGRVHDLRPLATKCHEAGALLVAVVTEPVSLAMVMPPGEMGADIVAAEGQAIGNALGFGGPYLGLLATRERYVRQMPGRIVGETADVDGARGWVLTLATREQHIRREKATSNICTNSGLCALAFTIHLALLGEDGFRRLGALNHAKAVALAERLAGLTGVTLKSETFFNEFTLGLPVPAAPVVEALAGRGILAGVPASRLYPDVPALANDLIVAVTETNSDDDMEALVSALAGALAEETGQ